MSQFGTEYSKYYDLLNSGKNYSIESQYVLNLIKRNSNNAFSILDLGCGTGIHDIFFANAGFEVHGTDISQEMLDIAESRIDDNLKNLSFSRSDIRAFNFKKKFDIVVSLFHVMSYQNSNSDLIKVFSNVSNHLKKDGVFIFDFWYGPAVLSDKPHERVKHVEDEQMKITRHADPEIHIESNIVDVNYNISIENKANGEIVKKFEKHSMRYFFDPELEQLASSFNLDVIEKYEWLLETKPNFSSWNVVWVLKKI